MIARRQERWLCAVFLLVALLFGGFEAHYGRSDYSQDAVCYLTLTHALEHHQWMLAGNSVWSVGYPVLILTAEQFTNHTPLAEWHAIHVLNLVILTATFLSFLFFLDSASEESPSAPRSSLALLTVALSIFVSIELAINLVSRVSPDMLVACFFLLSAGQLLRMSKHPSSSRALLLGLTLGCGYLAKGVFLPIACFAFVILAFAVRPAGRALKHLAISVAVFLVLVLPYALWMSVSLGRFTTGTAGSLNYAANVNHMENIDWQGGPPPLGNPIHPVRLIPGRALMYEFGQPFHVTYAPMYERFYFDEGFRSFFSPRYQLRAMLRNCHQFVLLLVLHPIFYAWILILALLYGGMPYRRASWRSRLGAGWPALVLAALSILMYLCVVVEPRYLPGFLIVLLVIPALAFGPSGKEIPAGLAATVVAIALLGAASDIGWSNRATFRAAADGRTVANDPSWELASHLSAYDLVPGDDVGVITHITGAYATWAYLANLNIVAEIVEPGHGGNPRTAGYEEDFFDYPAQEAGPRPNFWELRPEEQQAALDHFRQAGAAAVVSLSKPAGISLPPGWVPVAGTEAWIYRF
ncbi:MAG TPA: hypothetical protein VHX11_12920 [Acidobacteriaceae bacterium]|nr:hypothetical protein [Acidobacteriaceae bacterium]